MLIGKREKYRPLEVVGTWCPTPDAHREGWGWTPWIADMPRKVSQTTLLNCQLHGLWLRGYNGPIGTAGNRRAPLPPLQPQNASSVSETKGAVRGLPGWNRDILCTNPPNVDPIEMTGYGSQCKRNESPHAFQGYELSSSPIRVFFFPKSPPAHVLCSRRSDRIIPVDRCSRFWACMGSVFRFGIGERQDGVGCRCLMLLACCRV